KAEATENVQEKEAAQGLETRRSADMEYKVAEDNLKGSEDIRTKLKKAKSDLATAEKNYKKNPSPNTQKALDNARAALKQERLNAGTKIGTEEQLKIAQEERAAETPAAKKRLSDAQKAEADAQKKFDAAKPEEKDAAKQELDQAKAET